VGPIIGLGALENKLCHCWEPKLDSTAFPSAYIEVSPLYQSRGDFYNVYS